MTSAMLAVLVARLWAQGAPQPALSVLTGETLVCAAYTAGEIRSGGRHVFLCASSFSGEIEGALLRRNGVPVCPISGAIDPRTACYAVIGCGASAFGCL